MARLPSYTNKETIGTSNLDTGTQFMRLQSANTDVARAVQGAGADLSQLALRQQRVEASVAAKAESQAKADGNMMLESRLLDYQIDLQKEAQKRADEMPEGGFGFSSGLTEYAAKTSDDYIAKDFSQREDQDYVQLRFKKVRQAFTESALTTEYKTRLEWRDGVIGRKVDDLKAAVSVDPDNYDAAAKGWEDFVSNSVDLGSNAKERFRTLGLEKLARSELEARAARDPVAFRSAFRGSFENQPLQAAEPHVAGIIDAANESGLSPGFMLGVAKIESNVNPNASSPIGKNGHAMSSATGMWQILAAPDTLNDLGISKDDRTNYAVATPAIGRYFARQKSAIEARGQQATPGKLYMTWNVGPGAAAAVMSADPNTPIEQVLSRVWANKGPSFVNQALSNNPSMYRRGMTVGQVIANYEAKMNGAMNATKGYVTGVNLTTDEQARAVFGQMGIKGGQYIGARDAAEVFAKTSANIGKQSAEEARITRGVGILNGQVVASPYDTETQTAVNEAVAQAGVSEGVASGDGTALLGMRQRTEAARFIPLPDVNGLREAMNSGGVTEAKTKAYAALTSIATENPTAFDASKLPEDERARVKEFRAYTEVLSMSPSDAIKRIDEARTPEGKKTREAMAKTFDGAKGELSKLTFADIASSELFDKSAWSTPEAVNGAQQALATDAYKLAYRYYREGGKTEEEAKALSLTELSRGWGTSTIDGSQRFMQYPPEKYYAPVGGSYGWIHEQAQNAVKTHLVETGAVKDKVSTSLVRGAGKVTTTTPAVDQIGDVEVFLVPRVETAADIRSNKQPRYELWYRKNDGTTDVLPSRWFKPDQTLAAQEYDAEVKEKLKHRGKPVVSSGDDLSGLAYSP